jgi:hypothetical protein
MPTFVTLDTSADPDELSQLEGVAASLGEEDAGKAVLLGEDGLIDTSMLPPGGDGDMTKAVYDPNDDGKVTSAETADNVAWSGVTGKPATFPPDGHSHALSDVTDAGAMAGKDVVQAADVDSESATTGQVLTANGSGAAVFADVALGYQTGAATGDTTITTANTWYAPPGCSLPLDAGTWLIQGRVLAGRTNTTATRYTARLRNTTDSVTIDEAEQHYPSQNPHYVSIPLLAVVVLASPKTIRIEATANQGTTSVIKANAVTNTTVVNNATKIVAIKIG